MNSPPNMWHFTGYSLEYFKNLFGNYIILSTMFAFYHIVFWGEWLRCTTMRAFHIDCADFSHVDISDFSSLVPHFKLFILQSCFFILFSLLQLLNFCKSIFNLLFLGDQISTPTIGAFLWILLQDLFSAVTTSHSWSLRSLNRSFQAFCYITNYSEQFLSPAINVFTSKNFKFSKIFGKDNLELAKRLLTVALKNERFRCQRSD